MTENPESTLTQQFLNNEQARLESLKLQLVKLNETMEGLRADYARKHAELVAELNKTVGSTETLNKLLHAQKTQPKPEADSIDPK